MSGKNKCNRHRQTLAGKLFLWLLDQACLHTKQWCYAYGGTMPDGRVRVCDKPRWHWDSHTYECADHLHQETTP